MGHTWYGTSQGNMPQPIVETSPGIVLAHNGHIEQFAADDPIKTDTKVLVEKIAAKMHEGNSLEDALEAVLNTIVNGAYSLVVSDGKKLIAARDPQGFRPLVMGRDDKGRVCFTSEDSVLPSIGFSFETDVAQGEIIIIDKETDRIESRRINATERPTKKAGCMFEHVYFARPDSTIDGVNVQLTREKMGALLAEKEADDFVADMVVGVPDSGIQAAVGYANESGIPFSPAITKNRYITRTFIQDTQTKREAAVKMKQHPNKHMLEGKSIVLIDDSIVRGTTMKTLVKMLKEEYGVKEVHLRIASPPYKWPCYFGMDTGNPHELIANIKDKQGIIDELGVDSLEYLSVGDMKEAVASDDICSACADGNYPVPVA